MACIELGRTLRGGAAPETEQGQAKPTGEGGSEAAIAPGRLEIVPLRQRLLLAGWPVT